MPPHRIVSDEQIKIKVHYAWIVAGVTFLALIMSAAVRSTPGILIVPLEREFGWSRTAISFAVSVNSGWLSDRFSNRWLLFTYYGLRGMFLLFLPCAFAESHRLSIFAVFYGLDWIATVPPTVGLTARAFGREWVTLMFGWIIAAHQVGAALAAWGAGWVRSTEGAYDRAFLLSGGLCVLTAGAVLLIGRGSSRSTRALGEPSPAGSPGPALT